MEDTQLFLQGLTVVLLATLIFLVPKRSKLAKQSSGRAVILDSCALIDGRIVELAQAGFTPEKVIIPLFIIRELQLLADGHDSNKRERARFGLDVANGLKELSTIKVDVYRDTFDSVIKTDDKLIALARKTGALLYTTDFNLAKVAEVEDVRVLNVNELAQKLRPNVLPGETMQIKVIQKGSNRGQGVGYLDDGTMVVVEQGYVNLGKTVEVEVDRMHNTLSGKMIFAKLIQPAKPTVQKHTSKTHKPFQRRSPKDTVDTTDSEFVSDLRNELR